MTIEFTSTIPMLRIFCPEKARAFYVDLLGFSVDWEHRFAPEFPLYMQVSRGNLVLHLTEHHGDCCPGSAVYVHMSDLDSFHAEVGARPDRFTKPEIETASWNARVMKVQDPFGNRILFSEPIPIP